MKVSGLGEDLIVGNILARPENSNHLFKLMMKKLFLKNSILFGIITTKLLKDHLQVSMENKFKLMEISETSN